MIEIAMKMLLCLIIAALLGAIIGYIFGRIQKCDRLEKKEKNPLYDFDEIQSQSDNPNESKYIEVPVTMPDAIIKGKSKKGIKPISYPAPKNGRADDLKKIQGIGIKVENALYEVGIYHYSQIANWSNDNIEWIENYLNAPGRVKRENWIFQAKALTLNFNQDTI
jgi:predicted flap endonuclease-1-like 5' DNA nuclease